jgi:hypothetical protein
MQHRTLIEKLIFAQLIKKFPAFCRTQRPITRFKKLTTGPYPESAHSFQVHFILSFHPRLRFSSDYMPLPSSAVPNLSSSRAWCFGMRWIYRYPLKYELLNSAPALPNDLANTWRFVKSWKGSWVSVVKSVFAFPISLCLWWIYKARDGMTPYHMHETERSLLCELLVSQDVWLRALGSSRTALGMCEWVCFEVSCSLHWKSSITSDPFDLHLWFQLISVLHPVKMNSLYMIMCSKRKNTVGQLKVSADSSDCRVLRPPTSEATHSM